MTSQKLLKNFIGILTVGAFLLFTGALLFSTSNSRKATRNISSTNTTSSTQNSGSANTPSNAQSNGSSNIATDTSGRCIITINNQKYDVTNFRDIHSGGDVFNCGTDMTKIFYSQHGNSTLRQMAPYKVN